jgi:hypothetical protein
MSGIAFAALVWATVVVSPTQLGEGRSAANGNDKFGSSMIAGLRKDLPYGNI